MKTFFTKRMILGFLSGTTMALAASGVAAQVEPPKYGGTLAVSTVSADRPLLSWDLADRDWKQNTDTGMIYEQLFTADLSKSKRNGGPYSFVADAWLPTDAVRGELAESWKWTDAPLTLEVTLRKGVKFPARPGVMVERELIADDVAYTFNRYWKSPKYPSGLFDHVDKVFAKDKHTVVFRFNYFNSEWDYRFGWGYVSGIMPKEVVDAGAKNWKNASGTGPFILEEARQGVANTYSRNQIYWGKEKIGASEYKLPFVDTLVLRNIKDESTQIAALRTGKLDILESIRWQAVDELKRSAPQLKWNKWLSYAISELTMRVDTKPFNDIRVRRAMNMAVNKKEIVSSFYNGQAELFAYPQHPDFTGYFEPLEAMPASVKELFTYNPEGAKKLLAEAGYPQGFTFKVQVQAGIEEHRELLPLVAAYLEKVGVKMEVQPMEYAAFNSVRTSKTNAAGYFMSNAPTNPTTTIRKNFTKGATWNTSQWSDEMTEKLMNDAFLERDEGKRQQIVKNITRHVLDEAPVLWLPVPYQYTAWWPWVKNYGGELRAGPVRGGPIYARIWIDRDLKKKMGF